MHQIAFTGIENQTLDQTKDAHMDVPSCLNKVGETTDETACLAHSAHTART
jgi:hypothetical protein